MRHLTPAQRADLRARLQSRAAELRRALQETLAPQAGEPAALPRHGDETGDDAVADLEASLDATVAERETRALREVERALERLDTPGFGTCEDCGADIPAARLQASLAATRCVDCQSRAERARGATAGSRL